MLDDSASKRKYSYYSGCIATIIVCCVVPIAIGIIVRFDIAQ